MTFSELLKTSPPPGGDDDDDDSQYDPVMVCAGGYTERLLDTARNTSFRARCLMLMLYTNSGMFIQ